MLCWCRRCRCTTGVLLVLLRLLLILLSRSCRCTNGVLLVLLCWCCNYRCTTGVLLVLLWLLLLVLCRVFARFRVRSTVWQKLLDAGFRQRLTESVKNICTACT